MNEQELFSRKRRGDSLLVAEMLGLTVDNVKRTLQRTKAKRRPAILAALETVIKNRERLLAESKPSETKK